MDKVYDSSVQLYKCSVSLDDIPEMYKAITAYVDDDLNYLATNNYSTMATKIHFTTVPVTTIDDDTCVMDVTNDLTGRYNSPGYTSKSSYTTRNSHIGAITFGNKLSKIGVQSDDWNGVMLPSSSNYDLWNNTTLDTILTKLVSLVHTGYKYIKDVTAPLRNVSFYATVGLGQDWGFKINKELQYCKLRLSDTLCNSRTWVPIAKAVSSSTFLNGQKYTSKTGMYIAPVMSTAQLGLGPFTAVNTSGTQVMVQSTIASNRIYTHPSSVTVDFDKLTNYKLAKIYSTDTSASDAMSSGVKKFMHMEVVSFEFKVSINNASKKFVELCDATSLIKDYTTDGTKLTINFKEPVATSCYLSGTEMIPTPAKDLAVKLGYPTGYYVANDSYIFVNIKYNMVACYQPYYNEKYDQYELLPPG